MPRTDNSVAILTGMIIAALYVILLVGFSRESYMRRDAAWHAAAGWTMTSDISKRLCRIATASCGLPVGTEDGARACATPWQAVRRQLEGRMRRMSLQDLRDAVSGAP